MHFLILFLFPLSVHAACGGALEPESHFLISPQEIDLRVRIMPTGEIPPPKSRFEFEFQGERWTAEVANAQLTISRNLEVMYTLPLEVDEVGFHRTEFIAAGDHGLLTLESRAKLYVFSLDRSGAE